MYIGMCENFMFEFC
ncbi:hypothetical protein F383_05213 [Gossypium arboreum]|uniref:Uncharacterized protein n=1 Tax=Gossypium arboreum TaxID=29729 RepID=A0A0B0P5N7_GOSAR|nr:hypothetical protein F383_05213 [Gossypium arboreum]